MDFTLNADQEAIVEAVGRICSAYDDEYWKARDGDGVFPEAFVADMAAGGWLGIAMPEDVGGAGLGVTETALMMRTVAESGAAFQGVSSIHVNLFGPMPIAVYGTEEQRREWLPRLISGEDRMCFGVTEPNSGLDTSAIETKAERDGNGYVIHGRKIWTTTAQTANKIIIIARTTPREQCAKPTDGMSLFYTDMDKNAVEAQVIEKMGRKSVECNTVFIDGLRVPADHLIGEEGQGFKYLLHGLNPERILFGIEAVGVGRAALTKAIEYAKERVVFGRPIGQNQAIQHPLARCWAELEAAELLAFKAAALYDQNQPCGAEANAAKLLGSEAGYNACERAILTHGGMGYAREYHVERYFREVMIARIAPVSTEMILNFISERVLGLPRSY